MANTGIRRCFPTVIAVEVFLMVVLADPGYTLVTFGPAVNTSNTTGLSGSQSMAVSGANVYMVWEEGTPPFGVPEEVFFSRSTDGGATFGPAVNLSSNATRSRLLGTPQAIDVSGNNVYVVWFDFGGSPFVSDILFRRSTDGGLTFDPPVNLSTPSTGFQERPAVVASGSDVYVVWSGAVPGGGFEILFRKSTDNGATFGPVINVSGNSTFSFLPRLAVSGSNVYVVWEDANFSAGVRDILFARSNNAGLSFSVPLNISSQPGISSLAEIAVSGSSVHITWGNSNSGNAEVFVSSSTDGGAMFGTPFNLSNTPGVSGLPKVGVSGSEVYVAWQEAVTLSNREVFLRKSSDGGGTFGLPLNVSNTSQNSTGPVLAVSGSEVLLAWQESVSGQKQIFFDSSPDGGVTFDGAVDLSASSNVASAPRLLVSGQQVYVSWTDNGQPSSSGPTDIFLRVGSLALSPDHFLSYRVKRTKGTPKFERREVFLKDQFLEGNFRVDKPVALLNPADKEGEGIIDPETHLVAYKVKPPEALEDFELTDILIKNQFGEFLVSVEEPDRLLVPASKSLSGGPLPAPAFDAHNVDHFLCYKIEDDDEEEEDAPKTQASVQDQFNAEPKLFDIKEPRRLCNPADKNGEGIKNPDNHLLCYKVKPAKGEPKHEKVKGIFVNDQFGSNQVDTKKERELCVPSTKTLP